ncbi:hypothetical protein, partial [Corynebacterium sanguinis]|uniref:hypothetical protein n=1 Tax=Corynebacterium sanguinis TaxID=2594913 RepID=UPI00264A9A48
RRSGGLNEKRARIRTKSLFKPDLYSLICGNRKNQTHILLLNPQVTTLESGALTAATARWCPALGFIGASAVWNLTVIGCAEKWG